MNKQQIQQLMAIVRPAIIAVYGRQPLRLVAYQDSLAYQGHSLKSVYMQVYSPRTKLNYKAHIENKRVTSLCIGELKQ